MRAFVLLLMFCGLAEAQTDLTLDRGRLEVRGFGGASGNEYGSGPVFGVEAGTGLFRFLALTGTYAYNHLSSSYNNQELMAGLRLTWPRQIAPYFQVSTGMLRFSNRAAKGTELGYAAGFGADVNLHPRFGVYGDVRGVGSGSGGSGAYYARMVGGIFLRF